MRRATRGLAGTGFERGDLRFERAHAGRQLAQVVAARGPQLVERLAHATGGGSELVGDLLRALAGDLGLARGGLERLVDRGAHGVGARLGAFVLGLGHGAGSLSSPAVARVPIHLQPTATLAERALLPGDPGRALALAQVLLDTPKMFNHHRGLWGYTGTATDGAPLTIQATGMGGPSAAIVLEELCDLGLRRAVRVGTCGALAGGLGLGELVAATGVLAADGTSRALGAGRHLAPDEGLTRALVAGADHAGTVVSSDVFYDPDPANAKSWAAGGALAVEMEAAALLAVAARRGIQAGVLLAVSDSTAGGGERIGADALEHAVVRLGHVATDALCGEG